jgi:hypothetical protein
LLAGHAAVWAAAHWLVSLLAGDCCLLLLLVVGACWRGGLGEGALTPRSAARHPLLHCRRAADRYCHPLLLLLRRRQRLAGCGLLARLQANTSGRQLLQKHICLQGTVQL